MADSFIQLPPDSTGKLIDTSSLTVGANTVQRERDNIADPTDPAGIAKVENTEPASSDYGLVVRVAPSPTGLPIATQDAADGTVGATAPTVASLSGAQDTSSGDLVALTSTDGLLNISANIDSTFVAESSATWNSATALNSELDSAANATAASFTLIQTGVFSEGAIVFEQSQDGTNWSPISVLDNTTNQNVPGYTFVAGNRTFSVGFSSELVRARLSAVIVGTGSVLIQQITYALATPPTIVPVTPSTSSPQPVVLVPQVPGTNGVVNPQLVKTDPTTNDLLIQLIMEMRAVRVILSHLASETGDAQFNDFDPDKWVESDTIRI